MEPDDEDMAAYAAGESDGNLLALKAVVQALIELMAQQATDPNDFRMLLRQLAIALIAKVPTADNDMYVAGRRTSAMDWIDEVVKPSH
jgi:hypothetical protein